MAYKLSFWKITNLILGIAVLFFIYNYLKINYIEFDKLTIKNTNEITKNMKIREKNFYKKEKINNETTNVEVVQNKEEESNKEKDKKTNGNTEQNNSEKNIEKQENLKIEDNKKVDNLEKNQNKNVEKTEQNKKNNEKVKKISTKKYIQIATLKTEEAAKKEMSRIGSGATLLKEKNQSGKIIYKVVSTKTDNPEVLKQIEKNLKQKGVQNYIIKNDGK